MTHTSRVPPGSDDCDRSWAKDRSDARGLGGCLPLVAAGAVIRRRRRSISTRTTHSRRCSHNAGRCPREPRAWLALVPRLCDELPDPLCARVAERASRSSVAAPDGGSCQPRPGRTRHSARLARCGDTPECDRIGPASRTNATWEPSITSVPCGASLVREPASKERERSSAAHASAASPEMSDWSIGGGVPVRRSSASRRIPTTSGTRRIALGRE